MCQSYVTIFTNHHLFKSSQNALFLTLFFAFSYAFLLVFLLKQFFVVVLKCSGTKVRKQCNRDSKGNLRCPQTCRDLTLNDTSICTKYVFFYVSFVFVAFVFSQLIPEMVVRSIVSVKTLSKML